MENKFDFFLFELILYVPVNGYGHVGMLPPFYGTLTLHDDIMTSKKCSNANTQVSHKCLYVWMDFVLAGSDLTFEPVIKWSGSSV